MTDDALGGFLGKAFEGVKQSVAELGMRLVVHASAVAIWIWGGSRYGFSFWAYIGMICLVARGISLRASWVLPTVVGAAQTLLLVQQGMPLGVALFFGGLQTWLQRVFDKKGRVGREWIMAPIFCLGLGFLSEHIPFTALGGFAVGGAVAQAVYNFFRLSPMLRGRFGTLRKALKLCAEDKSLPAPLAAPLRRLAYQLDAYESRCKRPGKEALPVADAADDILAQLMRLKHRAQPDAWDTQAGKAFAAVDKLNDNLHARLVALGSAPDTEEKSKDPLERFHLLGLELSRKRDKLPRALHGHLDGILAGTERILECMRNDPADTAPGARFLNRYLPAAHRVVDEYARLAAVGSEKASLPTEVEDVLSRLEQAFVAEHARLLANDTMSLSAELKVLDKLLKMEGQ